ncbi:MAG TPA: hypothetical protein VF020_18895 [Chthoniobacterales bacterium]
MAATAIGVPFSAVHLESVADIGASYAIAFTAVTGVVAGIRRRLRSR